MKTLRTSQIVLVVLTVFAAAVLFTTYGTVTLSVPFASVQLDRPTVVDSNGEMAVIVDSDSRRALILDAKGDLTGVVDCSAVDCPFDAISEACVSDGVVYLAGVSFSPDTSIIAHERVVAYGKNGALRGSIFEIPDVRSSIALVKSLKSAPGGVNIVFEDKENTMVEEAFGNEDDADLGNMRQDIVLEYASEGESYEISRMDTTGMMVHDVVSTTEEQGNFLILDLRGRLIESRSDPLPQAFTDHVHIAIDIDDEGVVYACDDATGMLCILSPGSNDVRMLVAGEGFDNVHENNKTIALCDSETNAVALFDTSGAANLEITEVKPSVGYTVVIALVWASFCYLIVLALVFVIRKLRQRIKEGRTEGFGPMFMAVAVVAAVGVAIGNLTLSSYDSSLELRANEINMCADYLESAKSNLADAMEQLDDRSIFHGTDDEFEKAIANLEKATAPATDLVLAAENNGVGIYFSLYGKDDDGIFNLISSSDLYVMGSSARVPDSEELSSAFDWEYENRGKLLQGRSLRDTTQYRLVQIPTVDGQSIAGVIEIGSKMRSFEASLTSTQAQRILALLVLMLVVYLAYSELRSCASCLFTYRLRQQKDAVEAIALLTRPITLAVMMLSSIDMVMTVLIARDMLEQSGVGETSPLLAVPAVMVGIGMIAGQSLYGTLSSRVGIRRLAVCGAFVMMLCAVLTGAAVVSGFFWFYCAAKLALAVPFGLLYTFGYSLPRLARDDETRAMATDGAVRTETSAAALGTVLGGYAATGLGNVWVYALVAIACLPIILMGLNLLPRGMRPFEDLVHSDHAVGLVRDFVRKPVAIAIALFVVLPTTVAAGYASFLFPIYSDNLGLLKSDINNIYVLGQLVVYVCIESMLGAERHRGPHRIIVVSVALLGAVLVAFAVNTTFLWSAAVVVIVALLCKFSESWKPLWLRSALDAGVPVGRSVGSLFTVRNLMLIAQPFILGALLGASESLAVIVIGLFCLVCAGLFYLMTRGTAPTESETERSVADSA